MKKIKILLAFLAFFAFASCTNWNYIDSGVHDPNKFVETSMYDYLKANDAQFYLTRALIDRAGLQDLFQGKDPAHPKVMFFAPTWYAVAAGMFRKEYTKTPLKDAEGNLVSYDFKKDIENIPVQVCRSIILSYTFDKVYMRDAFPQGKRGEGKDIQQGGEILTSLNGNKLWVYRQQTAYGNFTNIHVNTIIGIEQGTNTDFYLASTDNAVKNGVVHSMVDGFIIKDLK